MNTTDIINAVCEYYKIRHALLLSRKRDKRTVKARQIAMYLCKELTDRTLEDIGDEFCKDHATVLYAVKVVGERPEWNNDVIDIKNKLQVINMGHYSIPMLSYSFN